MGDVQVVCDLSRAVGDSPRLIAGRLVPADDPSGRTAGVMSTVGRNCHLVPQQVQRDSAPGDMCRMGCDSSAVRPLELSLHSSGSGQCDVGAVAFGTARHTPALRSGLKSPPSVRASASCLNQKKNPRRKPHQNLWGVLAAGNRRAEWVEMLEGCLAVHKSNVLLVRRGLGLGQLK